MEKPTKNRGNIGLNQMCDKTPVSEIAETGVFCSLKVEKNVIFTITKAVKCSILVENSV